MSQAKRGERGAIYIIEYKTENGVTEICQSNHYKSPDKKIGDYIVVNTGYEDKDGVLSYTAKYYTITRIEQYKKAMENTGLAIYTWGDY